MTAFMPAKCMLLPTELKLHIAHYEIHLLLFLPLLIIIEFALKNKNMTNPFSGMKSVIGRWTAGFGCILSICLFGSKMSNMFIYFNF